MAVSSDHRQVLSNLLQEHVDAPLVFEMEIDPEEGERAELEVEHVYYDEDSKQIEILFTSD